jgi:uncharacterized membrane protein YqjE
MAIDTRDGRWHLLGLVEALKRLSATLVSIAEERLSHAVGLYRAELRRAASVLALSFAAALFAFASLAFIALTVMVAFWRTHPLAAAMSIAAVFVALALVAALLTRTRTASVSRYRTERCLGPRAAWPPGLVSPDR